ncbi:hypothetical protein KCP78_11650 [Salmonella enterica subsp. enterica]|nr:hypothetical protein KCP78_11650 [Salmonella enterica subsp. enterica]
MATFNEDVASVIEQLDSKVRAEQRVKRWKRRAAAYRLKPRPLTLLANETMDVERLREIAEEDNGSDVEV